MPIFKPLESWDLAKSKKLQVNQKYNLAHEVYYDNRVCLLYIKSEKSMVVGPQRLHRNLFTEGKLVRKTGKDPKNKFIQKIKLIRKEVQVR